MKRNEEVYFKGSESDRQIFKVFFLAAGVTVIAMGILLISFEGVGILAIAGGALITANALMVFFGKCFHD